MSDEYWDYKPNLNGELTIYNTQIWTNSKGQIHREDGAAKIWSGVKDEYCIDGIYLTKDEWLQYLKSGQSSLDRKTILKLILENS